MAPFSMCLEGGVLDRCTVVEIVLGCVIAALRGVVGDLKLANLAWGVPTTSR
jgi:hypothetical protein